MMSRVLPLALAMIVLFSTAAFAAPGAELTLSTVDFQRGDSCNYSTITVTETFEDTIVFIAIAENVTPYSQAPTASWLDQAAWAERQPKPPIPPPAIHGPLADWVALAALGRPASGGPGTLSHTLTLIVLGAIIVLISGFLIVEKYYLRPRHDEGCARD